MLIGHPSVPGTRQEALNEYRGRYKWNRVGDHLDLSQINSVWDDQAKASKNPKMHTLIGK